MNKLIFFISFLIIPLFAIASDIATTVESTPAPTANKFVLLFGIIVTVLLGISEALAAIPAIKANSIYQLIVNILKAISGKKG